MSSFLNRARERLLSPTDLASLALFRMALGALVTVSAVRFLSYGWVDELFSKPVVQLHYFGFDFVRPLPGFGMHAVFALLAVLGVLVATGTFFRIAAPVLFVAFTYVQLCDVSNYLNHYYLVSLLSLLLCFAPAHRAFSVDAWRNPSLRADTAPFFWLLLLRFQVATVYFFAGMAKLQSDWLLHAQPLSIWLSSRTDLPLVGPLLAEPAAAYAAAWGGFLFDTFVVAFLLWPRARPLAYLVVLGFHAMTRALFPIGMFPFIMSAAALLFFSPGFPRRALERLFGRREPSPQPAFSLRFALPLALAYAVVQLALPLRSHLYGGDVLWHEQGLRFSWRVMAREKNGVVTYVVKEGAREWHVQPSRYLTRLQERELSVQPDLILQLAHRIRDDFEKDGHPDVQVFADAKASLNGRPAAPLLDPTVDLAKVEDGFGGKSWITPAPTTQPMSRGRSSLFAGR